jgi:adenine phosphoribosyltransferase
MLDLTGYIRDVPDFPKEGIIFKDITTLLQDAEAFRSSVDAFVEHYRDADIDFIVAIESRGFIFGGALAIALGCGFIPVRKPGKLPASTFTETYELEYGTDSIEIHQDAIASGKRVLIIDDLLATGGTVAATARLLRRFDCVVVGAGFLIELDFLKGREKLGDLDIFTLVHY